MRTAVILTGQERSLHKIYKHTRKNLIEPNNSTLFLACEVDNPDRMRGYFDGIEIGSAVLLEVISEFMIIYYK